ncbi:TPA: hypothetical protein ACHJX8_003689 [Yersinia enterocolitica]
MVKFSLLENALDSVETGLENLIDAQSGNKNRHYKQCLLNLFQGAELLLKAAVSRFGADKIFMEWSLRKNCRDPINPLESELHACKSVDIPRLCVLIKEYYPTEFSEESLKLLKAVAIERNRIQHFAIEINPQFLSLQLHSLYELIYRPAFLVIQYDEMADSWNSALREKIISFEKSFLDLAIGDGYDLAMCPNCESWSHFIIHRGQSYPVMTSCICCGYGLKDLEPWDYHVCPECGAGGLVYDASRGAGVCLWHKCYYSYEGGFVDMHPCDCGGYSIEGRCPLCSPEDD